MAITQWPEQDRPREKLLSRGPQNLSDAELLALFLRTGYPGTSAVDLARQLISHFGGLTGLMSASRKEFCENKGLGIAKYTQLQAVLEMSARHLKEELQSGPLLDSSRAVKQFLVAQLGDQPNEVFAGLFVDAKHRLICYETLFNGTLDSATVYPREVLKKCIHHNAAAIIFAHNHPSGDTEPSSADKAITRRLQTALDYIDVRTLDHLVIGAKGVFSFAEHGLI